MAEKNDDDDEDKIPTVTVTATIPIVTGIPVLPSSELVQRAYVYVPGTDHGAKFHEGSCCPNDRGGICCCESNDTYHGQAGGPAFLIVEDYERIKGCCITIMIFSFAAWASCWLSLWSLPAYVISCPALLGLSSWCVDICNRVRAGKPMWSHTLRRKFQILYVLFTFFGTFDIMACSVAMAEAIVRIDENDWIVFQAFGGFSIVAALLYGAQGMISLALALMLRHCKVTLPSSQSTALSSVQLASVQPFGHADVPYENCCKVGCCFSGHTSEDIFRGQVRLEADAIVALSILCWLTGWGPYMVIWSYISTSVTFTCAVKAANTLRTDQTRIFTWGRSMNVAGVVTILSGMGAFVQGSVFSILHNHATLNYNQNCFHGGDANQIPCSDAVNAFLAANRIYLPFIPTSFLAFVFFIAQGSLSINLGHKLMARAKARESWEHSSTRDDGGGSGVHVMGVVMNEV